MSEKTIDESEPEQTCRAHSLTSKLPITPHLKTHPIATLDLICMKESQYRTFDSPSDIFYAGRSNR